MSLLVKQFFGVAQNSEVRFELLLWVWKACHPDNTIVFCFLFVYTIVVVSVLLLCLVNGINCRVPHFIAVWWTGGHAGLALSVTADWANSVFFTKIWPMHMFVLSKKVVPQRTNKKW